MCLLAVESPHSAPGSRGCWVSPHSLMITSPLVGSQVSVTLLRIPHGSPLRQQFPLFNKPQLHLSPACCGTGKGWVPGVTGGVTQIGPSQPRSLQYKPGSQAGVLLGRQSPPH